MTQSIRLIVGLGNPGPQYVNTRHNAGAWLVDQLLLAHNAQTQYEKKFKGEVAKLTLAGHEVSILLPATYMNLSGESVRALAKFYKIPPESILVVHDELDLPPGVTRLKQGGGHGGHNGLRSVTSCLSSNAFMRLRVGIGHPGDSRLVTDYVLHKPSKADEQRIEQSIAEALRVLPELIAGDPQKVMHQLHSTS